MPDFPVAAIVAPALPCGPRFVHRALAAGTLALCLQPLAARGDWWQARHPTEKSALAMVYQEHVGRLLAFGGNAARTVLLIASLDGAGRTTFALPVPDDLTMLGATVAAQALVFDASGPAGLGFTLGN